MENSLNQTSERRLGAIEKRKQPVQINAIAQKHQRTLPKMFSL
jgi:hypothetical protein